MELIFFVINYIIYKIKKYNILKLFKKQNQVRALNVSSSSTYILNGSNFLLESFFGSNIFIQTFLKLRLTFMRVIFKKILKFNYNYMNTIHNYKHITIIKI